jgi:hypothetical protein
LFTHTVKLPEITEKLPGFYPVDEARKWRPQSLIFGALTLSGATRPTTMSVDGDLETQLNKRT